MTKELKRLSIELSRFVVGTEGNVSMRSDRGFWIKASGRSFKEPRFVECDLDGKPLWDQLKPSMEVGFHSFIYRNSNYSVIAHTHPVNTLKILCSNMDLVYDFAVRRLFPDQVVFNGDWSMVIPYATPGEELTNAIKQTVSLSPRGILKVMLLKNHGVICCGNSIEEVVVMTEICEKAAEVFLGAKDPTFLTSSQIHAVSEHAGETYRKNQL